MTPKPLSIPRPDPTMNFGDTVTIEGVNNRPPVATIGWWLMLIFGPPFAARHFGWAFRRGVSSPFNFFPMTRRHLFEPRRLQSFVITDHYEHPATGEATGG
jgi:hypothetical protein